MCPGFRDRFNEGARRRTLRAVLSRVQPQSGGGGTLLTEPVVIWYGDHRGDYEALDPAQRLLASAEALPGPEGYRRRYELSDPDGGLVLGILVAKQSSGLPHSILDPDGRSIATIEPARVRFRVQRPVLASDAVIGSLDDRRIVARQFRTIIDDPFGRQVAVSKPYLRDSLRVAYSVEIHDFATPALRSVAVTAAILDDWTRWMYEAGG